MKARDTTPRSTQGIEKLPALLPELLKSGSFAEELSWEEKEKTRLFEEGLKGELQEEDTIEKAMEKLIKTALAIEFGPALLKQKGAKVMIETILRGIQGDSALRKQALMVISGTLEKQQKS